MAFSENVENRGDHAIATNTFIYIFDNCMYSPSKKKKRYKLMTGREIMVQNCLKSV